MHCQKDTLSALTRALKIREMIVKGADFEKMARDSSNDPSAKENGEIRLFHRNANGLSF